MKHFSRRPTLEILEERTLLSTCHVNRLGDSGGGFGLRGDLRYCINKVNDLPGPDTIDFKVTGTINLTKALPEMTGEIVVQGPGPEALTVRRGTGDNYRIVTVTFSATVTITGLSIANGRVVNDVGGGIFNAGRLTLDYTKVTGNEATNSGVHFNVAGGGIYNTAMLTISHSTIASNSSRNTSGSTPVVYGGGIFNTGTLTISDSVLSQNTAYANGTSYSDAYGGAIYNSAGGILTLSRSTVDKNSANAGGCELGGFGAGGGIGGTGFLNVTDSTVSGNRAEGEACGDTGWATGGGIWHGGTVSLTNSTGAQNQASCGGWSCGVHGVYTSGTWTIAHSTIYDGIDIHGSLTLRNSIISSVSGHITTSGYNLVQFPGGGSGYVPSDILNVDPVLGPLTSNGGPTQTMALLPGSPAIDSGTNQQAPEFDQRGPGFPRIVNGTIDRGAFEVQATGAPLPSNFLAMLITADMEADEIIA